MTMIIGTSVLVRRSPDGAVVKRCANMWEALKYIDGRPGYYTTSGYTYR